MIFVTSPVNAIGPQKELSNPLRGAWSTTHLDNGDFRGSMFTDRCFGIAQEVTALPVRHLPSPRVNRFYKNNSGPSSRRARKLSQQVRSPCTKFSDRTPILQFKIQSNIIHTAHKPYPPSYRFCSPPKRNLHPNPNRSLTTHNPE